MKRLFVNHDIFVPLCPCMGPCYNCYNMHNCSVKGLQLVTFNLVWYFQRLSVNICGVKSVFICEKCVFICEKFAHRKNSVCMPLKIHLYVWHLCCKLDMDEMMERVLGILDFQPALETCEVEKFDLVTKVQKP